MRIYKNRYERYGLRGVRRDVYNENRKGNQENESRKICTDEVNRNAKAMVNLILLIACIGFTVWGYLIGATTMQVLPFILCAVWSLLLLTLTVWNPKIAYANWRSDVKSRKEAYRKVYGDD